MADISEEETRENSQLQLGDNRGENDTLAAPSESRAPEQSDTVPPLMESRPSTASEAEPPAKCQHAIGCTCDRADEQWSQLAEEFEALREDFRQKLKYDQAKDLQITRLHDELQRYKNDLYGKLTRPFVVGLIRLHDDLGKLASAILGKQPGDVTPETTASLLTAFQDDVEVLLDQNEVNRFELEGEVFDPRRQTVVRREPTGEVERVGSVAARIRPGFERDGEAIQKERVAIFAGLPASITDKGETS